MPQSPQDVMQDPKFLSLSPDAQRIVLGKVDPKFAAMSPDAQGLVLQRLGKPQAPTSGQPAPPPQPQETGIWAGIKRAGSAVLGAPYDIAHEAFAPPRTPEEQGIATGASAIPGGQQVALGFKRLIVDPMQAQAAQSRQLTQQAQQTGNADLQHMANMHAIASGVPVFGPMAAPLVERYLSGDKSGALTEGLGYIAAPELTNRALNLEMPSKPPIPAGETAPSGGLVQRAVRSAMGMGEKPMVKGAKAALADYAEETGKVSEQNRAAAAKTNLENQRQAAEDYQARRLAQEQNEALRAQTQQRAALQQKTLDDSAALAQQVQQKALATRAEGQAKYAVVTQAVGDAGVPSTDIAALVKHAEDNILVGSRPESIRQFRQMLEQGATEPEAVASSVGQITPGSPLYQALVEQGAITPQEAATVPFRDMQGYVTELGDRMYGSGVPNDVHAALRYVRDGIKSQMQQIANEHGVGPQLTDAQQFWRRYEQTYNNARNVTQARGGLTSERIGSPVAKLVRMQDPEVIRALVTGNVSDRLVTMLSQEDPKLGAMAKQIQQDHAASSAPLRTKPKETPQFSTPKAPPEPKPLPESPNLPRLTEEARQAELDRRVKALRSPNVQRWEMVGMLTGLLGQLFGRHGSEYLTVGSATGLAGSALLARALESPRVIDWLTTPTAHDIAILNKLDPTQKAPLQQAITQTMINNRVAPTPAMRSFLSPSQSAAITAAIGAAYSTPQSIMLGMKMGQLSPTDGAAMLQKLRRSASAGPTRRLSQPETPAPPPVPQTY